MKIWKVAALALTLCPAMAHAQTAVESANRFTGGLLLQDTDYRNDDSFAVKGQLLEGGYKAAISPRFSAGGGVGIMFDGSIGRNGTVDNGEGFRLWVDGQYEAHRFGNANKIIITGALSHDRFSFSKTGVDVDFTVTELKVGGLVMHDVRDFSLYAGLEVVAYSHGDIDVGNFSDDIHRDDRLNLRAGASFNLTNSVALRGDLLLIGEQTLLLAADFAI